MRTHGILLINTGSPDSPAAGDVRRYLREFLMDPRVIDLPLPLRAGIVYGCILPFRPKHSSAAYRQIWTENGSPLIATSRAVAAALGMIMQLPVEVAMRYGNPGVSGALANLQRAGVTDVLVFPMFPHYAMSSFESAVMHVRQIQRSAFPGMHLATVPPYYADADYIEALAGSARSYLLSPPDYLLFSFHGMPVRHLAKADPLGEFGSGIERERNTSYVFQTHETARQVLWRLGWPLSKAGIAYQSRLGRDRWLEPHTDGELVRLARSGVRRVAVMCPSFTVDCLETLEEIAVRGRDVFRNAGGEELRMIPALNDDRSWIYVMSNIAARSMNAAQPCAAVGSIR